MGQKREEKNKRKTNRRKKGDLIFSVFNYSLFAVLTFLCAYPFYYLIINSISANDLSAQSRINFLPKQIHFQNYIDVMKLSGIFDALIVSVARTVIGTFCTVMASAFLGFMFTQKKMSHRSFFYRFIIVTMYFNAGLIPMFMTMKTLHLTNTFWVYIIPVIVQPFNIIMVKTYVESIPASLQEAAEIDGAGILAVFFRIILPISTPILATIAIWAAVGQWNSFQDTLIYVTNQKLYSLQYLLYVYINQASSLATVVKSSSGNAMAAAASLAIKQTPTSIRMTISVVVILPIIFIYPLFQKHFVKGIMIGAVKG